MNSVDEISKTLDGILNPIFSDKIGAAVVTLVIVLYAGLAAPKLPKSVAGLFKSKIFKEVFVNVSKTKLYVYNTDGSLGAARGAALGIGDYNNEDEAFSSLKLIEKLIPQESNSMDESYKNWKKLLNKLI